MGNLRATALVVGGLLGTIALARIAFSSWDQAAVVIGVLQIGPTWSLAFCLGSDESDFAGATRSRAEWLGILPWTFVVAPLVLPNFIVLSSFFRDARADSGRTWLGVGRDRPTDARFDEHHWPG
jgi:hypothetical protein